MRNAYARVVMLAGSSIVMLRASDVGVEQQKYSSSNVLASGLIGEEKGQLYILELCHFVYSITAGCDFYAIPMLRDVRYAMSAKRTRF